MSPRSSFDALVEAIERPVRSREEWEERPGWVMEAARRLAPDDRDRGIDLLCRRVREHDDSTACAALAALDAREAIPALRHAMLHGRSDPTRRGAAKALQTLGETDGVVSTLIDLLHRGSLQAAIDLRDHRDEPVVVGALKAGLEHSDALVRYHSAVSLLIVLDVIQDPESNEFGELVLWMSSGWACGRRRGRQGLELLLEAKRAGGSLEVFRGGYRVARKQRTPAFARVEQWLVERKDPPGPEVLSRTSATERRWLRWAMLRRLEDGIDADSITVLRFIDDELADELVGELAGQA